MTKHLSLLGLFASIAGAAFAQTTPTGSPTDTSTGSAPYTPGVTYQEANPNYPIRNPFYFEGRVDWNLLKITQPSNTWEYMERGIHKQDDLEDYPGAIADYQQSIAMNNVGNKTCQLVTVAPPATGKLDPPPCMFTVRLRLAGLLRDSNPKAAIAWYQDALDIDPLRLGVHAAIAETYVTMAGQATALATAVGLYQQAISEYTAELALSPVTALQTQVTGDTANNAHVHWELAEVYEKLNQPTNEINELNLYLQATKWHSDTYPWRIQLAQKRIAKAQAKKSN